ncbi:H(+)-transporting V1 sector ATPase subunit H NDAI_0A01280 [Naumovozyma dairenensis CBS 421]|uniref:V-type proton ATPase subunit H n=1 Tax=Naumovozyma dairenensis (strain ATCC 10597 / BCRC 20456 / CBS 421 / NBRC 0211 / NRRL Y-12639) TaxID=1071378 RepID=G0W398_NAUDC|nr:hypothetical protein NDAI_0A01280 [Naumovozyma dairenensis CBS 421]CCD22286.1 hypothetical protein NDAI_0A01280 [Naumovozyma dairenensis CBS 421]
MTGSTGDSKPIRILLDSIHFNEIRKAIRSRSVGWDALIRAEIISQTDGVTAKRLEKVLVKHEKPEESGTDNESLLKIDDEVLLSLLRILKTSDSMESQKATQNLIAELLSSDEYSDVTVRFFQENPEQVQELFDVSMVRGDSQTVLISAFNLVSLLIQDKLNENKEMVIQIFENENFIKLLQNYEKTDTCYVCIRLIQELMTIKSYKKIVWDNEAKIVPTLFIIIKRAINETTSSSSSTSSSNGGGRMFVPTINNNSNNLGIQIQYYSLLLIWLMTFNSNWAREFINKYLEDFLKLLKLIKVTIKEKISRLSISIILQCCSNRVKGNKQIIKDLILLGDGIPTLQSLSERKYSDEELRNDIIELKEILEDEYKELTSFDEYIAELDSKLLCWSPPHIDNGFWSDNINEFKENNWKIFKKLINLLIDIEKSGSSTTTSQTKLILQVALNDITHVIELLPESVNVLSELGGKVVIMELLNHSDSRVKYEALKATQAMIGYKFR